MFRPDINTNTHTYNTYICRQTYTYTCWVSWIQIFAVLVDVACDYFSMCVCLFFYCFGRLWIVCLSLLASMARFFRCCRFTFRFFPYVTLRCDFLLLFFLLFLFFICFLFKRTKVQTKNLMLNFVAFGDWKTTKNS